MSSPTVAGLCVRLDPQLAPAPGFVPPRKPISAVHISELVDPTAYLAGGELLLTTGMALPRSTMGCGRYVRRLVDAGVAALAFGLGPVHTELPRPLLEACEEAGLCLLVVPPETPFLTITKAYWTDLGRSTEQHLVDVLAMHQRLVDAAATAAATPQVLRTIVGAIGDWGAVLDPDGRLEAVWPPAAATTAETLRAELGRLRVAGVRSAASFLVADRRVALYPLAVDDRVVGYLAVGSSTPATAEDRRLLVTASALLSIDLVRRRAVQAGDVASLRSVCLLLDLGLPDAAVRLAARLAAPPLGARVRLLAVQAPPGSNAGEQVRRWCPDAFECAVDDRRSWFVLPVDHPPWSELEPSPGRRAAAWRVVPSGIIALDEVPGVRARLMELLDSPPVRTSPSDDPASRLQGRLSALLERRKPDLGATLVAYLRHRGQWEPAARALGIHRNTLRARIERCREVLGADLDDPDVSAPLWLLLGERGLTGPQVLDHEWG